MNPLGSPNQEIGSFRDSSAKLCGREDHEISIAGSFCKDMSCCGCDSVRVSRGVQGCLWCPRPWSLTYSASGRVFGSMVSEVWALAWSMGGQAMAPMVSGVLTARTLGAWSSYGVYGV